MDSVVAWGNAGHASHLLGGSMDVVTRWMDGHFVLGMLAAVVIMVFLLYGAYRILMHDVEDAVLDFDEHREHERTLLCGNCGKIVERTIKDRRTRTFITE